MNKWTVIWPLLQHDLSGERDVKIFINLILFFNLLSPSALGKAGKFKRLIHPNEYPQRFSFTSIKDCLIEGH